jgi:hypothetical protein
MVCVCGCSWSHWAWGFFCIIPNLNLESPIQQDQLLWSHVLFLLYQPTKQMSAAHRLAQCCSCAAHSGSKMLKPAENEFIQSDFTSFSLLLSALSHNFRFRSLHIQNLSNHCRHKNDPLVSRNFNLIFGGFSLFGFMPCGGSICS